MRASPRVELARLARLAALGTPGVLDTDPGPDGRFTTVAGDQRIDGVTCIAAGDSGYEVSLRLVCGLVPLLRVAQAVRSEVTVAAARAALPLEAVNVDVVAVRDPRFDADLTTAVPISGRAG